MLYCLTKPVTEKKLKGEAWPRSWGKAGSKEKWDRRKGEDKVKVRLQCVKTEIHDKSFKERYSNCCCYLTCVKWVSWCSRVTETVFLKVIAWFQNHTKFPLLHGGGDIILSFLLHQGRWVVFDMPTLTLTVRISNAGGLIDQNEVIKTHTCKDAMVLIFIPTVI